MRLRAASTLLAVAMLWLCNATATPAHAQIAPAEELHVAAAADLQPVFPEIAAVYERTAGVHITASFGSSATLTQQLENGAPQDLFLSADTAHPAELIAKNVAEGPAPTAYARGVLVLWARKDSPAQPLSLDSLRSAKVSHIAVANELHAPYGAAAMAALRALQLIDVVKSKLVVAENVLQTAQFADTGNAQLALISQTIANSPHFRETGISFRMPTVYPPIRQAGVVIRTARNAAAARAFLAWLASPIGQAEIARVGLDPAQP